jgi:hypothetical protein
MFAFRCLDDIRATFSGTQLVETILGPAIDVVLKALSAANRNGKIFVFHTNLPTFDAPGRLKNREEDRKLFGTDKEKVIIFYFLFMIPRFRLPWQRRPTITRSWARSA